MKAKAASLADIARKPSGNRRRTTCRICLAPEQFSGGQSSLNHGICRDRTACEQRHPPFPALTTPPLVNVKRTEHPESGPPIASSGAL